MKELVHYLINPYWILTSILILLLILNRKNKTTTFLLSAFLILWFSMKSESVTKYLVRSLEAKHTKPPQSQIRALDAVVILGGGTPIYDQNRREVIFQLNSGRLLEGIELFKTSQSRFIIFTGRTSHLPQPYRGEAETAKILFQNASISETQFVIEPYAINTFDHTVKLKPIFEKLNIKRFYLVTSYWHMPRAAQVFKSAGLEAIPYPVDTFDYPFSKSSMLNFEVFRLAIREYVGWVGYKLTRLM